MVVLTTSIITLFAAAYIAIIFTANKKIIDAQQKKIDEIFKSGERYKALFENSSAGMMKFNFSSWVIVESNQAMLDMFNANSVCDLQKILMELPRETLHPIETALTKEGMIDAHEINLNLTIGITRRFFFSARREGLNELAHAVVVLMNSEKKIG